MSTLTPFPKPDLTMAAPALNIPPPVQPHDPAVIVPAAAQFPPSHDDALRALKFRSDVENSKLEKDPTNSRCTPNDQFSALKYEHAIVSQATAADFPQAAPPWFHAAVQAAVQPIMMQFAGQIIQAVGEVTSELRKTLNHRRGDGLVVPFATVPFVNGDLPQNLPQLDTLDAIDNLNDPDLLAYLTGYGIQHPPFVVGDADATRHQRREWLRHMIGATGI